MEIKSYGTRPKDSETDPGTSFLGGSRNKKMLHEVGTRSGFTVQSQGQSKVLKTGIQKYAREASI